MRGGSLEAGTHLETALTLAEACRAPFERARTLLPLASLRCAEGDTPDSRAPSRRARAPCLPLGASPDHRRSGRALGVARDGRAAHRPGTPTA